MSMTSGNPALTRDPFAAYAMSGSGTATMTISGTVGKTSLLLAILTATGGWTWTQMGNQTLSPVLLFAVVLGVIQGLQYFTQAYVAANVAAGAASQAGGSSVLEQGYPEGSTLFYPILLYYHGFKYFSMGYASAMAVLLLVVAFAFTAIVIRQSRRWVHYQGAVR